MESITLDSVITFLLQSLTLLLIGGIFYTIGAAIVAVVKNKQPRWDMLIFVVAVLALALVLLRMYPGLAIGAIADGLEGSRAARDRLTTALRQWVPTVNEAAAESTPQPPAQESEGVIIDILPTAEQLPTNTPAPTEKPQKMTPTPAPTATAAATPAITPVPTLDLTVWNPGTPPPTPEVGK